MVAHPQQTMPDISARTHDPRRGEQAPCVLVVGMHRSGTSATTGVLRLLGLAMPRAHDLMPAAHDNAQGHLESRMLSAFDDKLLADAGGSWQRPPVLAPGWHRQAAIESSRLAAPGVFEAAFGTVEGPVAWKDPRASLLLEFWRDVLDRPLVAILSCRDPLEVAASLEARDGIAAATGIALWERYQRSALEGLRGLPVFVTHYRQAFEHRDRWIAELSAFLRDSGVKICDPDPLGLGKWLDPGLWHQRSGPPGPAGPAGPAGGPAAARGAGRPAAKLLPAHQALVDELDRLVGAHASFDPGLLAPPDPASGELLAARAETAAAWNETAAAWSGLKWAAEMLEGFAGGHLRRAFGLTTERDPEAAPVPHGLNATEDTAAYHDWLKARGLPTHIGGRKDEVELRPLTQPPRQAGWRPRFSIVVPVYRTPGWALRRCVGSVLAQSTGDWELCLCDDASADPGLERALVQLAELDPRIKVSYREHNGGISAATNTALGSATGEFVVFLDHDDELTPDALAQMAAAIDASPHADILYSDEDKTDESGERFAPSFKPGWSPDTLLSCAYMCHLLVVRRSLVAEVGGLRTDFDGAQDYDLMLRATERARAVVHVPHVLYHWRIIAGSAAGDTMAKPWAYEAGRRAVRDALARRRIDAVVDGDSVIAGMHYVRRAVVGEPLVSIVVPFRDEPSLLTQCFESICESPGYSRFEVLLVDNGSVLPETSALLDQLSHDPRVVLLEEPGPFSWAAINTDAAREASGDLLLFMNNDVEATTDGWLLALVEHAQRAEVGAVGGRLLYPNRTIQHAGVVLGMCFGAAHVLQDVREDDPGYLAWAFMTRNCSAVTGACMMTRRDLFEELGGFALDLPISFSDIDYCLKARDAGKLVVYTPLAELVHHESHTRGHTDDAVELPRFLERWREALLAGDPYHHPYLSRLRTWCPLSNEEEDELWRSFLLRLDRLPDE
jgi:GT2 family glycosyltransferase